MSNLKALNEVIYQVYYILNSKQRKKAIIVLVSMILTSGLELLGVSTIYPFLQMMVSPEKMKNKFYMRWLYSCNPSISDRGLLIVLGGTIIFVFLLKNIIALRLLYIQNRFAVEFQRDESTEMLNSYLKRPYLYFINTNTAEIIRGVGNDTNSAYTILLYLFQLVGEMITIVFIGFFLIKTDCIIALGSFALVVFAALTIIYGLKNKNKIAGEQSRKATKEKNQYCFQAINGIKEIIVLDRREEFVKKYNKSAQKASKATLVYNFLSSAPDRILEGICISGVMGIICVRILLGIEIDTFVPTMGTFAMGAFKILPSISKISTRINGIIYNRPGLQSCYENISAARKYSLELNKLKSKDIDEKNHKKYSFKKELNLNCINWKYNDAQDNIINDLSLKIEKGKSVAFIGSSGSGKTTLADIIMGLFQPQSGTVEMDGISVFDIPHQWSRIIGYVPQSVFLIDDTIRANVAFGVVDEDVNDEKIWGALDQAQLKQFVEALPQGLDTIVGERGIKFSGGQRQRIAIARALYEDPEILVLDEATSALDSETEAAVMESIDALQGRKTLIIVAHRLSTIKNCDMIYEIVDGKAIERTKKDVFKGI